MPSQQGDRGYHHGNLRDALITAAVDAVSDGGVADVSMRELARRVGVSHSAAAHHFGDKTGLLTAVAATGFRTLADSLRAAWEASGSFAAVGVAYVRFAVDHPAHFEVMFRPELYRADDPALASARTDAGGVLYESARQVADAAGGDEVMAGFAGWAYVHGITTLWKDGNVPPTLADDPVRLAERIGPLLFQASRAAVRPAEPRGSRRPRR